MTGNDIKQFFIDNPHLKVNSIIKESGIPSGTFFALRADKFKLSKENEEKLKTVFKKYNTKK